MGHNFATDVVTAILIMAGTAAITIPITIGAVLQIQEKRSKKQDKNQ